MIYAAKAALYIRKKLYWDNWRIGGFCKVRVYLFGKKGFWGIFHICQTCWKNGDMGHMERGDICFMEISKYIHETCWKKMDMGDTKRICMFYQEKHITSTKLVGRMGTWGIWKKFAGLSGKTISFSGLVDRMWT